VFPEQIAHWRWMADRITEARRPLKVLNLFGYTGVASLVAAKAGAEVTHVDASKKAIGWARENQALARLEDRPIRWICEDAMKFIAREERRGNRYDIILTDPPKFGRGPNGEVWQLFEHLPLMLDICRELLSDKPVGLVLTAYSIRASFYAIHELMRETMRGAGGRVESGELIIRESGKPDADECRALSTSLFQGGCRNERSRKLKNRRDPGRAGQGDHQPLQPDDQGHPRAVDEEAPRRDRHLPCRGAEAGDRRDRSRAGPSAR
jgi:23S rRNA (cytosine1962-C5)-methyltransferase